MEVEQGQDVEKEKQQEKENIDISNLSLEDQENMNDENSEPAKNNKGWWIVNNHIDSWLNKEIHVLSLSSEATILKI